MEISVSRRISPSPSKKNQHKNSQTPVCISAESNAPSFMSINYKLFLILIWPFVGLGETLTTIFVFNQVCQNIIPELGPDMWEAVPFPILQCGAWIIALPCLALLHPCFLSEQLQVNEPLFVFGIRRPKIKAWIYVCPNYQRMVWTKQNITTFLFFLG